MEEHLYTLRYVMGLCGTFTEGVFSPFVALLLFHRISGIVIVPNTAELKAATRTRANFQVSQHSGLISVRLPRHCLLVVFTSAFLTQGTVSSISIIFSWGGSISPEGFLSSVLLWLVIIVAVVGVTVVVVIIVAVVVVVESSSVVKLSFVIT
ncbi:hypothetical protein Tco_1314601 [Tanacetum coccineum]